VGFFRLGHHSGIMTTAICCRIEVKMFKQGYLPLLVVIALLSFSASDASDNPDTGLRGVVTDATGASVPKARVLLVNTESLDARRAEVPMSNKFEFLDVGAGEYVVIVVGPLDTPCWKTAVRQVQVQKHIALDLRVPLILDTQKCSEIVN
jgi:hypothetical protein